MKALIALFGIAGFFVSLMLFMSLCAIHNDLSHGITVTVRLEKATNYWGVAQVNPLDVRVLSCTNYPPYVWKEDGK